MFKKKLNFNLTKCGAPATILDNKSISEYLKYVATVACALL